MDELIEISLEYEKKRLTALLTASEIEEISSDANKLMQTFKKLEYQQKILNDSIRNRMNSEPCSSTATQSDENEETLGTSGTSSGTSNTEKYIQFKWNDSSIKLLLDIRLGQEAKFNMPTCKKSKLWNQISTEMKKHGDYNVSGNDCNNKYRNLLSTYRHNKDKRLKLTGESKITWEYFNIFDETLGTKQSSAPSQMLLCSALENSQSTTENPPILDSLPANSKINKKNKKKENTMNVSEHLFQNAQKSETIWQERKEMKQEEVDAINNLADAIRASCSRKRQHKNCSSDYDS